MSVPYMTTDGYELLQAAVAADPAVTALFLVASDATTPAGWSRVVRADGLVALLTAGGMVPAAAAGVAVAALDLSAAAVQARFEARNPQRQALRQAADQAVADINAYLAIAPTATAAQVRDAVTKLAQMMKSVILRLKQID